MINKFKKWSSTTVLIVTLMMTTTMTTVMSLIIVINFLILICNQIYRHQLKKLKLAYLREFWNVLDLVVLSISLCCIAFNIYRHLKVESLTSVLLLNPNYYVDFDYISYWQTVFNSALAIMVFFAWIKVWMGWWIEI